MVVSYYDDVSYKFVNSETTNTTKFLELKLVNTKKIRKADVFEVVLNSKCYGKEETYEMFGTVESVDVCENV